MLAYTRERLLDHLQELSAIVDLYQKRDPSFPALVVQWLTTAEKTFSQLRLPLASLLAAERAGILAVGDGFRDASLVRERLTPRKAAHVTASIAVGRVQEELRRKIQEIDGQFDVCREKLAQFLAIATTRTPIPAMPGSRKSGAG